MIALLAALTSTLAVLSDNEDDNVRERFRILYAMGDKHGAYELLPESSRITLFVTLLNSLGEATDLDGLAGRLEELYILAETNGSYPMDHGIEKALRHNLGNFQPSPTPELRVPRGERRGGWKKLAWDEERVVALAYSWGTTRLGAGGRVLVPRGTDRPIRIFPRDAFMFEKTERLGPEDAVRANRLVTAYRTAEKNDPDFIDDTNFWYLKHDLEEAIREIPREIQWALEWIDKKSTAKSETFSADINAVMALVELFIKASQQRIFGLVPGRDFVTPWREDPKSYEGWC